MRNWLIAAGLGLNALASPASGAGVSGGEIQIAAGSRVYAAQCASCHGATGEGVPDWERPDTSGEMPAPPHDSTGHTWKHSDAMLYRIVRNGWRDPYNKTTRLTMPAFGQTLSPGEVRDVIAYLKTMWAPEQRKFQIEESEHAPFPPEALSTP
ncbi:MAG: cytochrome c [Pseudomonadota bacterium]|nr:cytochrome c [Pseudomonadota bacterium]